VFAGKDFLAQRFNAPELRSFLWLLPVCVCAVGLVNTLSNWAACEHKFGAIAWSGVGDLLCDRSLAITLGYLLPPSAIGLFLGRITGAVVNVLVLLIFLGRTLFSTLTSSHLTLAVLRAVGLKYKKFPLFGTWSKLLIALSVQLPSLFLGLYFSPTIVGYYALMQRVSILPITFLGQTIGQVFYPIAAKEYRQTGTISRITREVFTRLVQIGIFPMAVLGLFGAPLFRLVFGQQWTEAGVYAQILAGWYFVSFLSLPLDIFNLLNRQDIEFLITLITLAARIATLYVGVRLGSPRITVALFALVSIGIVVILLIWKMRLAGVSGIWMGKTILGYLAVCCTVLLPAKGVSWIFKDIRVDIVVLGMTTLCYGTALLVIDSTLRQFVADRFKTLSHFK
jgi:O-antigen/teichoic acid export membrane protein